MTTLTIIATIGFLAHVAVWFGLPDRSRKVEEMRSEMPAEQIAG